MEKHLLKCLRFYAMKCDFTYHVETWITLKGDMNGKTR